MRELHLNEQREHGSIDFPLGYYYVSSNFSRYIMEQHWHIQYEIIHIIQGSFRLKISNTYYQMHEGDYAFIHSGLIHGGMPQNCIYECVVFDADFLRNRNAKSDVFIRGLVHNKYSLQSIYSKEFLVQYPYLQSNLEQFFASFKSKHKFYELQVMASLLGFFAQVAQHKLYCQSAPDADSVENMEPIKKTLERIQNNYAENISLDDLAKIAGLSGKYFCHIFQKLMGRTPIDYLNNYRIERAASLIEEAKYSLIQICYDCGFNDYSYFIRVFKKYKNTTPKQYKKNLEQDLAEGS